MTDEYFLMCRRYYALDLAAKDLERLIEEVKECSVRNDTVVQLTSAYFQIREEKAATGRQCKQIVKEEKDEQRGKRKD